MVAENIINVNVDNYNEVVNKSTLPILVDFWAPWCGPCRAIAPVLEQLAAKYDGKIKIGKVNVDVEPTLAAKFRVMSIPTLILFKDGNIIQQTVGLRSIQELEKLIEKVI